MAWFRNAKTASKLAAFLCLMLVMLAATAWAGISSSRTMKANQEATFEVDFKTAVLMSGIQNERLLISRNARDAIIFTDPARVDDLERQMAGHDRVLHKHLDDAEALVKDENIRRALTAFAQGYPEWLDSLKRAIAASRSGDKEGGMARTMLAELTRNQQLATALDAKLTSAAERAAEQAAERARNSQTQYEHNILVSVALLIVVVLAGAGCTIVINGAISTPLRSAVDVLGRVAKGDLTPRIDHASRDEIGELAGALNASLDSIASTLTNVQDISTEVSSAATQLAASAQQISAGSQEQAASLEETAASLEEISSTVRQNTDNAQEASQLANSARDAAERGGQVVSSAVAAMSEITKSSRKIADIITTIDEIAFQTNLLALNAAVEAARAGEQGRGFGVVAAEVRTLAQRTGTAAKEIRGLIADSSSKVEVGTSQVNESGRTLDEIVRSVKRVTDMVAEIAAASREQNTGLDQVNTAVTQIDQVTQTNAAQTEELSATAASLSDKSGHLQKLVAAFELGHGASATRQGRGAVGAPLLTRSAPTPTSNVVRIGKPSAPLPRKVANGGFEEF